MVQIKTNLANKKNYGGTRSLSSIKYIVIHYTANDGDTDENNGTYFHNNYVGASAHYFVDDDSVTRSVPDENIAWHCGANTYKHKECRNTNSIGVEICDDVRNGTIYPSAKTIANAIELVEWLMDKYNVPKSNVIRHYDVTGKLCPAYWCGSAANDAKWKSEFWNKLKGSTSGENTNEQTTPTKEEKPATSETGVLYRVQTGAFSLKKNASEKCHAVKVAGFNAFLVQVGALWKVQVGAFAERKNADAMVKKLQAAGFSAIVVKSTGEPGVEKLSHGSTVRVKKGAKTYEGVSLQPFIYGRDHVVKSISGDRVVITYNGIVIAAIHRDNLIIV